MSALSQTDFQQNILQLSHPENDVSAQQRYGAGRVLRASFTVRSSDTARAPQGAGNPGVHPLKLLFNNKRGLYLELFPWSSSIQGLLSQEALKG